MAILASESPTFQPAMRIISTITQAYPATVTTTFDHDYESGLIVRIKVPTGFGMTQLNKFKGQVTVTSATQFTIDIDTRTYDAFAVPATSPEDKQYGQVVPVAEENSQLTSATRNVLPY